MVSWLSLSKLSGNGNDTVTASVTSGYENTGRSSKSTTVTFKAANCADVTRTVIQAGKPETTGYASSTASVIKAGGTVTLTGTSNSKKLTFSLGTGDLSLTLPATYTAGGVSTTNGSNITGDPGASQEYAFSIQFTVAENTSTSAMSKQVIVTDDGGTAHTCTITIAAGDATLSVSPASIELPWDGATSGTFTVTSNTNWTVE